MSAITKKYGVAESRYENKILNNPKYLLFNSERNYQKIQIIPTHQQRQKYKSYPPISNAPKSIPFEFSRLGLDFCNLYRYTLIFYREANIPSVCFTDDCTCLNFESYRYSKREERGGENMKSIFSTFFLDLLTSESGRQTQKRKKYASWQRYQMGSIQK